MTLTAKTLLPLQDIDTDPEYPRRLTISEDMLQAIALGHGYDGEGQRLLRASRMGQLEVVGQPYTSLQYVHFANVNSGAWEDLTDIAHVCVYGGYMSDPAVISMQTIDGSLDGVGSVATQPASYQDGYFAGATHYSHFSGVFFARIRYFRVTIVPTVVSYWVAAFKQVGR